MDPTAALVDLLNALGRRDRDTAFDRLEALLDWLSKGGAFPRVPTLAGHPVPEEE